LVFTLYFRLFSFTPDKGLDENTGESLEECINKYQKNKAVVILETEKQLIEVINFLKSNAQELQEDLNSRE